MEIKKLLADKAVDLAQVDFSPRPWLPGAEGLLRWEQRHLWWGHRGCGKSLAALTLGLDVCIAGGKVLMVDVENYSRRTAGRRNDILKCRPSAAKTITRPPQFTYIDSLLWSQLSDLDIQKLWCEEANEFDLVIIDSLARALGQSGRDENSNKEVASFFTELIDPLKHPAVLILDNVGHEARDRSRGASVKEDFVEVAYGVHGGDDCAKDKHGTITLTCNRGRDGDEVRNAAVGCGAGSYTEVGRIEVGSDTQRAICERIIAYLVTTPGSSETNTKLAKAIDCNPTHSAYRSAVDVLEAEGRIGQRKDTSSGKGRPPTIVYLSTADNKSDNNGAGLLSADPPLGGADNPTISSCQPPNKKGKRRTRNDH